MTENSKLRPYQGANMTQKVVSKLIRIQIGDEIRGFLKGVPFVSLKESQVGNHVYWAAGKLKLGSSSDGVTVRIWIEEEQIQLCVRTEKAGIEVKVPFGNKKERKEAAKAVIAAIQKTFN